MNRTTDTAHETELAELETKLDNRDKTIEHLGHYTDIQQRKLDRVNRYLTEYATGEMSAEMAISYIFMAMGRRR